MVDRTGLFVAPLPGSTPAGTSPTDGRLVLGAAFGTSGGCLSGGVMTASGSTMQVTVAAAVWRIPDPTNTGGVYLSPADVATLTFSAGPASGSRIDVIWVRQNNYEAGDANSRVVYGVTAGTAASSPVAPAIPAGALKIGQLTVPTGAGNTAACTLVTNYGAQSIAPPPLAVATTAALPASGAHYGQLAYVSAVNVGGANVPAVYRWNGSAWKPWDIDWQTFNPAAAGAGFTSTTAASRMASGQAFLEFASQVNNQGNSQVTLQGFPFPLRGNAQPQGTALLFATDGKTYPLVMVGTSSTTLAFSYQNGAAAAVPTNGQSAPAAWLNGTLYVSARWATDS